MANFDVGDTVRVYGVFKQATFTVVDGVPSATYALADPTTATLIVQPPTGQPSIYTFAAAQITRASEGIFFKEITLTVGGTWRFRWAGTGDVQAAERESIFVRA